ncbi:hypothetical protein SeLEV6574_g02934 [Synchytrium endobioticum]|uniref:Sugar phosphate transporter domain-containing protein n=1 Tax=Synchytrium endobioticum TaxID=286115 RepID=A0A507D6P6_9FUNG|nr:hypothetical protein SeLEV6574_g02934 [Synchytrium endobioticum]
MTNSASSRSSLPHLAASANKRRHMSELTGDPSFSSATSLNLSDGDLMPPPYDASYSIPIPTSHKPTSPPHLLTHPTSPNDYKSSSKVHSSSLNNQLTPSSPAASGYGGIRININNINYNQYNILGSQENGQSILSSLQSVQGFWNNGSSDVIGGSFSAFWDGIALVENIKFVLLCLAWYTSSAFTNNLVRNGGFFRLLLSHIQALFQITGHVFSSIALSRVTVSFAHTIKALAPLFTVVISRIFFDVYYAPRVYYSLLPLTAGVMLVCANNISFNWLGFVCALAATIIFVIQNIVSKKLFTNSNHSHELPTTTASGLKKAHHGPHHSRKLDKINLLFYSSFLAFTLMTPLWLYSDGINMAMSYISESSPTVDTVGPSDGMSVGMLFFLNGVTHFAQNLLAFWLLSLVSPVTYSVASLLKRIFVIASSIFWFSDKVTSIQVVGLCLTFYGLWNYGRARREVAASEILLDVNGRETEYRLNR